MEGIGPFRRLESKRRNDNLVRLQSEEGIVPDSRLVFASNIDSSANPQISDGMVPERLFEAREIEVTFLADEHERPLHTGDEHLFATFAQLQEG